MFKKMANRIVLTLLFVATINGVWAEIRLDQPSSVAQRPGDTVKMSCVTSGYTMTSYSIHWIRKRPGRALEWMGWINTATSVPSYASAFQSRFSFSQDVPSNTQYLEISGLTAEDSAVYYCALIQPYDYFAYWGKGTQVTVTSATSTAPTVFPVMPCGSGTGDTVTLACLATGFSPSAVSFAWSLNDKTLDNSIQYPPVLKDNLYSGVSQLQVTRQEWEARKTFKCKVDHAAGSREVNLIKPNVVYIRPSLEILTSEDDRKVTFSCLANDFTPKVYEFKWLKDNVEITDKLSEITTPSKDRTTENGTLYTAASFLTLSSENMQDDTQLMCIFNLGRGDNVQPVNVTHTYRPPDKPCPVFEVDVQMDILPPSVEHMLLYRKGKLVCTVKVKTNPQNVREFFWSDENDTELVNSTRSNNNNKGKGQNGWFTLPLDITFDEWNSGITRTCEMHHDDLPYPVKQTYQRQKDEDVMVDMIELYNTWNHGQEAEEDDMQNTALTFIILFLITLLFCIGTTAFKVK